MRIRVRTDRQEARQPDSQTDVQRHRIRKRFRAMFVLKRKTFKHLRIISKIFITN